MLTLNSSAYKPMAQLGTMKQTIAPKFLGPVSPPLEGGGGEEGAIKNFFLDNHHWNEMTGKKKVALLSIGAVITAFTTGAGLLFNHLLID